MKHFHCLALILPLLVGCTQTEEATHVIEFALTEFEPRHIPGGASMSPEEDKIVLLGDDGIIHIVDWKLWADWNVWAVLCTITGHTDYVHSARFSPDGKRIISTSDDGTLRIFDADSGAELRQFPLSGEVIFATFSPDEKQIVTGDKDGTARLWDADMVTELQRFEGHIDAVPSIVFSPDGKRIATSSDDGTVRLWDVESGKELDKLVGLRGDHVSQFLPDGMGVLLLGKDDAFIWDIAEEAER